MTCVLSNNESDQCSYDTNPNCKHCDHGLDIFLQKMNIDLFDWQRELLKKYIREDRPVYFIPIMPRRAVYLEALTALRDVIFEEE